MGDIFKRACNKCATDDNNNMDGFVCVNTSFIAEVVTRIVCDVTDCFKAVRAACRAMC